MYALKVTAKDCTIIITFTEYSLCVFSFFAMANDQASLSFMQLMLFIFYKKAKAMQPIVTC